MDDGEFLEVLCSQVYTTPLAFATAEEWVRLYLLICEMASSQMLSSVSQANRFRVQPLRLLLESIVRITLVFPLPEMRRRNYGNSLFDVRHNLEMSYIYELPFGKGRKFVTSGVASKVAGGWQLTLAARL